MERQTCYVCLEPCENEFSPCKCKMPVHAECLERFICSDGRTECSVCKSPLKIETFELDIVNMPEVVISNHSSRHWIFFLTIFVYYLTIYCLTGWFGKFVHLVASETTLEFDADFWNIFSWMHFLYALTVVSVIICMYRSCGFINDIE